jgi:membrane fusion protein, adhesin transport system
MSPTREDDTPHAKAGAGTHMFLLLCVALVVAFGAWAHIGQLDIVSDAQGEVVPATQVKSIQNLEGGIVREILAREGDRVKADQPLVVLESTASGADVQELTIGITSLRIDVARLVAEKKAAAKPMFDDDLIRDYPNLVRRATELFQTRRRLFDNELAGNREIISQRREEIEQISSRLSNEKESLKLLEEQIGISEELLKDDLTNRMVHLNLLKEASDLRGRVGSDKAALRRAKAVSQEAKIKLSSVTETFQEEVRLDLEEKRRSLEERRERVSKFEDNLQRRILRSPVDGVVKTLHVFTIGGVVQPGATVVDVVPEGDSLVIEAKLPTQDVGYVHAGQTALITLASADAMRFGNLKGEVVLVSPDTIETSQGTPFYKVRIKTNQDFFERNELRYQLVPGVQVLCSIRTGQRSVLEYLMEPFLGSFRMALRER